MFPINRAVGGGSEPNGKLGKLPKNQRLKDAMAQHKNAKPKPKGWLMSVVEQIYKDGETNSVHWMLALCSLTRPLG